MFIYLWKPTHKLLGTSVKHSAVDVILKQVNVMLHGETVRQLKLRVRGGNAYTLIRTATYTSDMELVPDVCPEKQRSRYDGYNVADAVGVCQLGNVQQCVAGQCSDEARHLWHQYGDVEGCR